MKVINSCVECQRLWRAYSVATAQHIRVEAKLKLANIRYDTESIMDLIPREEEAALKRSVTRGAIDAHELAEHQADERCRVGALLPPENYHP